MASETVGSLHVELDASANKLGSSLDKAGQDINRFSKKARKDLGDVDGSFLDKLASKAKEMRKERRTSGESALESMMTGRGVTEWLNLGVKGLLLDVGAKAFAGFTEGLKKVVGGEMSGADAVSEWAKTLPIIGDVGKGLTNIIELTSGQISQQRELNKLLKEQALVTAAMAGYRKSDNRIKVAMGEMGSVEAQRLDAIAGLAGENSKLAPTDAEIREKMGSAKIYLSGAIKGSEGGLGHVFKALGVWDQIEKFNNQMWLNAENEVRDERKGATGLNDVNRKRINEWAKIQLQAERKGIAMSGMGGLSSLLGGFQDMPGGDTPQAQRMQKLLKAYTQGAAMAAPFEKILHDGNASDAQKAAARLALEKVHHWTDLATSSKMLDIQPYVPLKFASAELANQFYGGAAQYASEKDMADYAKTNDLGANQLETNKILTSIDRSITDLLKIAGGNASSGPTFNGGDMP